MRKKRKHVPITPSTGFVVTGVWHFYSGMKSVKNDDLKFEKAVKLASRSYSDFEVLGYPSSHPLKKSRGISAACKVKASEVIVAL